MKESSGERMPKQKRINRILWIAFAIAAAVFGISFVWYQARSGQGWSPTVEIVFQLLLFLSGWVAQGTLATLFILKLVKMNQAKPIREFTKVNKYRSIRRLSLWIAAIPGLVLTPLLITLAVSALFKDLGMIFYSLAGFSFLGLIPGAMAMFTLLVLAVIKASKKPIDPQSPTPKLPLIQIILAGITTAIPVIAFFKIWLNAFNECVTNCFIFNDLALIPLAVAYASLWLVQAIIWFGNRNKLTR